MDFLNGIKIIESPFCVEKVWNFKQSRHRSSRVHKKLIKRFGCQYFERPAAYIISGQLSAHPEIIKQMMADKRIVKLTNFDTTPTQKG